MLFFRFVDAIGDLLFREPTFPSYSGDDLPDPHPGQIPTDHFHLPVGFLFGLRIRTVERGGDALEGLHFAELEPSCGETAAQRRKDSHCGVSGTGGLTFVSAVSVSCSVCIDCPW